MVSAARSKTQYVMIKQSWPLWAMLLPVVASCSPPPRRYQAASVSTSEGRLCYGVADRRETRAAPPEIAIVSMSEVGRGLYPVWQRKFWKSTSASLRSLLTSAYPMPPARHLFRYCRRERTIRCFSLNTRPTTRTKSAREKSVYSVLFYLNQHADDCELKPIVVTSGDVPSSSLPPS